MQCGAGDGKQKEEKMTQLGRGEHSGQSNPCEKELGIV